MSRYVEGIGVVYDFDEDVVSVTLTAREVMTLMCVDANDQDGPWASIVAKVRGAVAEWAS